MWVTAPAGSLLNGLPGSWYPVPAGRVGLSPGDPAPPGLAPRFADIEDELPPHSSKRPVSERLVSFRAALDPPPPTGGPRAWLAALGIWPPPDAQPVYVRTGRTETVDEVVWREFALR